MTGAVLGDDLDGGPGSVGLVVRKARPDERRAPRAHGETARRPLSRGAASPPLAPSPVGWQIRRYGEPPMAGPVSGRDVPASAALKPALRAHLCPPRSGS
jgi:hypothetical protein